MKEFPFDPISGQQMTTETSTTKKITPVVDERHVILLLRNNKIIVKTIDMNSKTDNTKTFEFSNCVVVMNYGRTVIVDVDDSNTIYWSCDSKDIVSITPDTKF